MRRRLLRLGAIPLKSAAYLLPNQAETLEDFLWLRREIVDDGGDASVCTLTVLEGVTDRELEAQFRRARDEEYAEIVSQARQLGSDATTADVDRLRGQLAEVTARDFFGGSGRDEAERAVRREAERLQPERASAATEALPEEVIRPRNATWVTRKGIFVDRMASAWLIGRFIDQDASFKFVEDLRYKPEPGELRFDMFDGEYTHQGDQCTFETLLMRFRLDDPALRAIAEVVHDIDCKDEKFQRAETAGVTALIRGIALSHDTDEARIKAASSFLDSLYAQLRHQLV